MKKYLVEPAGVEPTAIPREESQGLVHSAENERHEIGHYKEEEGQERGLMYQLAEVWDALPEEAQARVIAVVQEVLAMACC